jgi:hypothetical protein
LPPRPDIEAAEHRGEALDVGADPRLYATFGRILIYFETAPIQRRPKPFPCSIKRRIGL